MQIVKVKNVSAGEHIAKEFLYKNSDFKTVLFLSGGKTPKSLYTTLIKEDRLKYAAVGMIDERYGEVGHENSNALIMDKFDPFIPILTGKSLEETARDYNETITQLLAFKSYGKSIGILGIGADGHTAGIPAGNKKLKIKSQKEGEFVTFFEDFPGDSPKRLSATFKALGELDQIIIMVFGEDKKEALRKMFETGPVEEIPARFFLRPEIAKKTTLVTDQKL